MPCLLPSLPRVRLLWWGVLSENMAPLVADAITYWDDLAASIFGYQSASEKARIAQEQFASEMKKAGEETDDLNRRLADMNDRISSHSGTIEGASREIQKWMDLNPEIKQLNAEYHTETDEESLEKTTEVLNQAAKSREVEIDLQTEKIKAQADIVTESIRWKAQLDIEEVKAATERLKAAFSSIDESIKSTGEVMTSLWDTLASGELSISQQMNLEDVLEEENERRRESFELQKGLTEQQIRLTQEKTAALERGEALITIDGAGLQPHLEAFMWEILEAIQIRANAEGSEFLLGI